MNAAQFAQQIQESPGCGQSHPDTNLPTVLCRSHASGLHSDYSEAANELYEWGDE